MSKPWSPTPANDPRAGDTLPEEATLLLLPAYGRKYASVVTMLADWDAGRDFKIHRGMQVNKFDVPEMARQGIQAIWLQGSYLADAPTIRIDLTQPQE